MLSEAMTVTMFMLKHLCKSCHCFFVYSSFFLSKATRMCFLYLNNSCWMHLSPEWLLMWLFSCVCSGVSVVGSWWSMMNTKYSPSFVYERSCERDQFLNWWPSLLWRLPSFYLDSIVLYLWIFLNSLIDDDLLFFRSIHHSVTWRRKSLLLHILRSAMRLSAHELSYHPLAWS